VLFLDTIGAPQVWAQGYQGDGVRVAVIDSGGRNGIKDFKEGKTKRVLAQVTVRPDQDSGVDAFGHGTFVAGIIGSNGNQSNGQYLGVAPQVEFLSVRVNDENGAAKVSDVVAGLQWVFDNKDAYNIRVVNLSLNSTVPESYHTSPLDAAVEILWFNGVAVVVAAGNNGDDAPGVLFPPANDPFAIVVGATDDLGTVEPADDKLAAFSAFGVTEDGFTKPDLSAPGTYIVSSMHSQTRFRWDYGSHVVQTISSAGRVNNKHFQASGTSAAAAVVSGSVALLLDAVPDLTPDQVKFLLAATANPLLDEPGTGAGVVDADSLVNTALTFGDAALVPSANTGLDASQLLWTGDDPVTWGSVSWNSVSWNSVSWNSVSWNSVSWNSVSWNSVSWNSVDMDY
jgi:serine protease AprX